MARDRGMKGDQKGSCPLKRYFIYFNTTSDSIRKYHRVKKK